MKKLFIAIIFILFTLSTNAQKIFSVSSQFDADLKIYFVGSQFDAGWRKSSKKYLLY